MPCLSLVRTVKSLVLCAGLALALPAMAQQSIDPAQRLAALSYHEDLAADDPRVQKIQKQLVGLAKRSKDTPEEIAAACYRTARHLYDATRVQATPLELLEPLDKYLQKGQPLTDTLHRYVALRKAAPNRTHAEAMAGMAAENKR